MSDSKPHAEATPRPWYHLSGGNISTRVGQNWAAHSVAQAIESLREVPSAEVAEANAALIVRAVNLHEEMLQLVRDVIAGEPNDPHYRCVECGAASPAHPARCWIGKRREQARAILAKAEEGGK